MLLVNNFLILSCDHLILYLNRDFSCPFTCTAIALTQENHARIMLTIYLFISRIYIT